MRKRPFFILLLVVVILGAGGWLLFGRKTSSKVTYQTGTVAKGTLVVSVSASGQMNGDNRIAVTANVTGAIDRIYVKNGETVRAGQRIMHANMDASSQLAASKAKSSLLQAQNSLAAAKQQVQSGSNDVTTAKNGVVSAEQQKTQLHQSLLQAQNALITAQQDYDAARFTNTNGSSITQKNISLRSAQDALYLAQQKYNAADGAIAQAKQNLALVKSKTTTTGQSVAIAQENVNVAQQNYAQSTGDIVAPVGGTVNDIILVVGNILAGASNSGTAGSGASGIQVATVITSTLPTATLSVAETDVPKMLEGQKATLTFDAISGKTFTGTVVGVNRSGTVSSGVTTYPMTIQLDAAAGEILPNMSVSAEVITKTEDGVLLVPSSGVKTRNGTSTVQVMINGQPQSTTVAIGDASNSQTVITGGLTEGQTVVTATITAGMATNGASTSLFSGQLRSGGGGTRAITGGGPPGGF